MPQPENPNIGVSHALLDAMRVKDLSKAPLAETVCYESPLTPEPLRGRAKVIKFLTAYGPMLTDLHPLRHFADGDEVASVWQAQTIFGVLSIVYLLRIEGGLITEIQAFYDPRPFLEGMGR